MPPSDSKSNNTIAVRRFRRLLIVALFLWIAGVSVLVQGFFWVVEQVLTVSGIAWPSWAWFVIGLFQGTALIVPTALLALIWRNERAGTISRAWAIGALYVFLMVPMRLLPSQSVIAANAVQIGLTLLAIACLILIQITVGERPKRGAINYAFWLAILVAISAALPWLMWGALGSIVDTLLNLLACLLFGLLAALILNFSFLLPKPNSEEDMRREIPVGGLVAMGLLIEMSSAFGFGGLQLLLLIVVPSFALAAAGVRRLAVFRRSSTGSIPVALLVGLVAAAPSMFVDPNELALVLAAGGRDLLQWAIYAALASATIGWTWGILIVVLWAKLKNLEGRPILASVGALTFVLGAILYLAVGQPGFYGDQLFVILKDQADLNAAVSIDDVDERRAFVYETLVSHASETQQDLTTKLAGFGIEYTSYYLVNSLSVNGGPVIAAWLESIPEVDRVLSNPVLRPLRAAAPIAQGDVETPIKTPWNIDLIGASQVWQDFGVTGSGIVVGQSDSGVDGEHNELKANYRGRSSGNDYNWYDPWNGSNRPVDVGGHGTHTLATAVGANTGVAPGAEWIGCVNLARNLANPSLYLDCLQFMLAPYPQGGDPFSDGDPTLAADVLNNSWGCPPIEGCDPDSLLAAVRALRYAGIFVVVSAGNEGPFCESVSDPLAIYDEVLSVGAVDQKGALAFFSSVGPVTVDGSGRTKPDILAPGVAVLSAFPGNTYEYLDGTSMAGPHLAGVVALMWSANPLLKGDISETEQILMDTTFEYEGLPPACSNQSQLPYNGTGFGMVNAYSAVRSALELSE